MKKLLWIVACAGLLQAESLPVLIDFALQNNPALLALQSKHKALYTQQDIADIYPNPVLSLGLNDIRFDELDRRDLEPMQTQFIALSQRFPTAGKLGYQADIVKTNIDSLDTKIASYKVELVSKIKKLAYRIKAIELEMKVIGDYEENTRQISSLHGAYDQTGINHHLMQVKSDMMLSQVELQKSSLQHEKERLLSDLSYLSAKEVRDVETELTLNETDSLETLIKKVLMQNPRIKELKSRQNTIKADAALADANRYPDITANLGYFNREDFEDYVNVSIGIPLNIYGRESKELIRQKHRISEVDAEMNELKQMLENEVRNAYFQSQEARERHALIEQLIDQNRHAVEVVTGVYESGKTPLEQSLSITNELFQNERLLIREKLQYNLACTTLQALQGEN